MGSLIVGCLYLPNGNPAPGPKFDYKVRWFERLMGHAKTLLDSGAPAVLAGDFNVMLTDLDVPAAVVARVALPGCSTRAANPQKVKRARRPVEGPVFSIPEGAPLPDARQMPAADDVPAA